MFGTIGDRRCDRGAMPTQKSIPERYPVLEYTEARLQHRARVEASRPTISWVGALLLGGAGGALLAVAFVAVVGCSA